MSMVGKQIRLERLFRRDTGNTVIVPMDHGVTMGPIPGLVNMRSAVDDIVRGGVNAVIMHKGNVGAGHRGGGEDVGLFVHLSASTVLAPDPNRKVLVCSVEEAVRAGADGISIHINLGAEDEADMLADLGSVGRSCADWGMPLLAMMYTRGDKIADERAVENVAIAARVAAELGADLVKVDYTGDVDSFRQVTDGCAIPVLIAGGEKAKSTRDILQNIHDSLAAGGRGVSIGRNAFQHARPTEFCRAVSAIVHDGKSVEEALAMAEGGTP